MAKKPPYGIVLLILNFSGILLFALISLNLTGSSAQDVSQAASAAKLLMYGFSISLVFSFLSYITAILLKPALSIKINFLNKIFLAEFFGFLTIFLSACYYLVRF
ncbi:hypothetical protein [Parafilimonas terrae]|uniref:Uncharacterized protein n=1 Tax=Parafilimonas terrae TaxID=1465490 RepID=A0A1I5RRI4_9BACT|nr:hypothetical protein [Parafilimonas terrae]SFP61020.1 hypothetical protein SAMN05444277_101377 [Parafilimonas terrae]